MNADDLAKLLATQFNWEETPGARAIATWVGHKFLYATGRDPYSDDVSYNVKDLRRAVGYLRIVGLTGFGTGKTAAKVHDRVREMTAWHATGVIIVSKFDSVPDPLIDWADNENVITHIADAMTAGASVLAITCEVDGVGSAV